MINLIQVPGSEGPGARIKNPEDFLLHGNKFKEFIS